MTPWPRYRGLLRPVTRRGLAAALLAALTVACAPAPGDDEALTVEVAPEPGEDNLKASFAAQIEGLASIGNLQRSGDELMFTERREGDTAVAWRVTIDSVRLEPRPDEAVPVQGNVVSSWYADGELIEPLGSMSRLPDEIFDAGLAQECWALWDAEQAAWGW